MVSCEKRKIRSPFIHTTPPLSRASSSVLKRTHRARSQFGVDVVVLAANVKNTLFLVDNNDRESCYTYDKRTRTRTHNANVHDGRHVPETVLGGRGRDDGRARAKDTSERARAGRQKRRRRRRREEEEEEKVFFFG